MNPTNSSRPRVVLTASVDTEEDNWVATRNGVTVSNIRTLPRMHERMAALGLRITHFCANSVVTDPTAAAILKEIQAGGSEIGAHLHPWNTPPLDEPMVPRNSMLKNLPPDLQWRKIRWLTDRITETFAAPPTAFRAGRFAIGTATVEALIRCGYRVDSSVMPWANWSGTDDGPDFIGAPDGVYRLAPGKSVTTSGSTGTLVEVPISSGFNRWPFSRWAQIHRRLTTGILRRLRFGAIAQQTGLLRQVMLSPEGSRSKDMIRLARMMVSHGAEHLQLIWHSPSLVPGLTPFTRTNEDVERLYRSVAEVIDAVSSFASVTTATVSETAKLLMPDSPAENPPIRA